jgi:hypothetical protein
VISFSWGLPTLSKVQSGRELAHDRKENFGTQIKKEGDCGPIALQLIDFL